jgi:RNA polymerase sigma factor (sigma-70 family)
VNAETGTRLVPVDRSGDGQNDAAELGRTGKLSAGRSSVPESASMASRDTQFVFDRLQGGDEQAAREVFDRYLRRLVALARSRLSDRLQQKVDADDIVQSAFRSFFVRARDGQYVIERSGDLWSLLASITRNKLLKKAEHFRQQKRDLQRDLALTVSDDSSCDQAFIIEPTIEEAAALSDEVEFLMRGLAPRQRTMLELRLQGRSIPQIADTVERSERTVRRFLIQFRQQLEERLYDLNAN